METNLIIENTINTTFTGSFTGGTPFPTNGGSNNIANADFPICNPKLISPHMIVSNTFNYDELRYYKGLEIIYNNWVKIKAYKHKNNHSRTGKLSNLKK